MKIRVSDLPERGLPVSGPLELERLNNRLTEGDAHGIQFVEAPEAKLIVTPKVSGAEAVGEIHGKYRQPCARCTDSLPQEITIPFSVQLRERPADTPADSEQYADDIGLLHFSGEHVELDDFLEETLILELSPFWKPECDNEGRCSVCKRTLPEIVAHIGGSNQAVSIDGSSGKSRSLGDLLKKAGIK